MQYLGSQAAQDLLWAINGAQLMAGPDVLKPESIDVDQIDGEQLAAFIEPRISRRVGRYFEALVEFWLRHIERVELLGAGVQLRDGKRTVGELDFVFRDHDDAVVHLEVAVKYFLHHPAHGRSNYPGPNPRDSFEVKANKLFDEQLPRSLDHGPDIDRRAALVPGMIFYRPSEADAQAPKRLASGHRRGRWIRMNELDQLEGLGSSASIHRKPFWLAAPCAREAARDDMCRASIRHVVDALHAHFAENGPGTPVMVSVGDDDTPPGAAETPRLFVVSSSWPSSGRG